MSNYYSHASMALGPYAVGQLEPQSRLRALEKIVLLGFFLVSIDAVQAYMLKNIAGFSYPVNAVAAAVVVLLYLQDPERLFPSKALTVLLAAMVAMFILGFYIGDYELNNPFLAERTPLQLTAGIVNSAAMLMLGYYCFRWMPDSALIKVILLAGIAHGIVNTLAISGVYPSLFPVNYSEAAIEGKWVVRMETTTDQNFMVFYFLPSAALLVLPFQRYRTTVALLVTLMGLYSVVGVQTRSGTIVLFGCIGLAGIAPMYMKELGRKKTIILACLGAIISIIYYRALLNIASGLIFRFTEVGNRNLMGRLGAIEYFAQNFWKPHFMIPSGPGVFTAEHGNHLPHSNITSMMLRGGIIGVVAWFAVYFFPR